MDIYCVILRSQPNKIIKMHNVNLEMVSDPLEPQGRGLLIFTTANGKEAGCFEGRDVSGYWRDDYATVEVPKPNKRSTRGLLAAALISFPVLFLLDWTGIYGRHFPKSWEEAVIEIGINLGWTIILTLTYYFVMMRPFAPPKQQI